MMADARRVLIIDYTNYRGERRERRIRPLGIHFANDEWHPETQWLLEAVDEERNVIRDFAMVNIHSMRFEPPAP